MNKSDKIKIKKTQNFYNKYPLSDGEFRRGSSVLKTEDIQINLKELERKKVLDCGCGTGNTSIYLLNNVENLELTLFDISVNSLKVFKERLRKNKNNNLPNLVLGDVLNLSSKFKKE